VPFAKNEILTPRKAREMSNVGKSKTGNTDVPVPFSAPSLYQIHVYVY